VVDRLPLSERAFAWATIFHSLQYMGIVMVFHVKDQMARPGNQRGPIPCALYFYGISVALAYAILHCLPRAYVFVGFGMVQSLLLVIAAINIHHFIVDAYIWHVSKGGRNRSIVQSAPEGDETGAVRGFGVWSGSRLAFLAALALLSVGVVTGITESFRFEGTPPRVTIQYQWYLDELARRGRHEDWAREWEMVARIDEEHRVTALTNLGGWYVGREELERAESLLEQALALEPQSVKARINLASALAGQGRYDEAVEQLDQVLRVRPNQPTVLSNLEVIRGFQAGQARP